MEEMRLNKYLAYSGLCSRREGDDFIASGRVLVNGKQSMQGQKVSSKDVVTFDGKEVVLLQEKPVYAYYKPMGVTVTKKDAHAERILYDEINIPEKETLKYAGRLDRDSEGLLLLTADGDLIEHLMRGSHLHEKEYIVTLDAEASEEDMRVISAGVYLEELERKTRPITIKRAGKRSVTMTLKEGLNREIRRLWESRGKKVLKLKRIRVASVLLGDLKPGAWRKLSEEEVMKLKK